tara:strand:- start:2415 stop:3146 length:732 start_codon:yes stop_codon:yes gene_type:complete
MTFANLELDQEEALTLTKLRNIRKKINEESWSDNMENLMKQWGEKAAGLRFMHSDSAKIWKSFSDNLSILAIFITALGSGLSLATTSISSEYIKTQILYTIGGIGFVSTLVQSLKKFYNAEEKVTEHNSIAKQFGSFYRYMTLQMNMSREDREPADILTAWALKEYERLQNDAPLIDNKSLNLFKNKFNPQLQAIPDISEDKFIIKVVKNNVKEVDSKEIQVNITDICNIFISNQDVSNQAVF